MPEAEIMETDNGLLVSLEIEGGYVRLAFENIEQFKSHQIESDVTTWQEVPGLTSEPFSARLNVLSLNNREMYRRNLDDAFGKGGWTTILNRACGLVRHSWQNRERSVDYQSYKGPTRSAYALPPYLVYGSNIFFGQGNSGKTWLGLLCARSHVTGEAMLGAEWSGTGNALYVDYEADGETLAERCYMLGGWPEGLRYWPAGGVPLTDQLPALRAEIAKRKITFVVVDSAGLACGGEPEKAEVAIRYFNAIQSLKVPTLTIAHQRKNGETDEQPFGSNFWHTSARQIWKVRGDEQEEAEQREIGLFHTKWNNVPRRERPIGVRMEMRNGGVSFWRTTIADTFDGSMSLPVRIRKLLIRQGEMTVKEIAADTGAAPATVRMALNQRVKGGVSLSRNEKGEQLWVIQAENGSI